jgi:hypothetical protein
LDFCGQSSRRRPAIIPHGTGNANGSTQREPHSKNDAADKQLPEPTLPEPTIDGVFARPHNRTTNGGGVRP